MRLLLASTHLLVTICIGLVSVIAMAYGLFIEGLAILFLLINVLSKHAWLECFILCPCFAQIFSAFVQVKPSIHVLFQEPLSIRSIPSWLIANVCCFWGEYIEIFLQLECIIVSPMLLFCNGIPETFDSVIISYLVKGKVSKEGIESTRSFTTNRLFRFGFGTTFQATTARQ